MPDWLIVAGPLAGVVLGVLLTSAATRGQDRRRARAAAVRAAARFEQLAWPNLGTFTNEDLVDLRVSLMEAGVPARVFAAVSDAARECAFTHDRLTMMYGRRLHPSKFPKDLFAVASIIRHVLDVEIAHPHFAFIRRRSLLRLLDTHRQALQEETSRRWADHDEEAEHA